MLYSSQILAPAIYGLVYTKTVVIFPRAIFTMSMAIVAVSFVLLAFVRLPKDRRNHAFVLARSRGDSDDVEEEAESELVGGVLGQEETLVDTGNLVNRGGAVLLKSPPGHSS